MREPQALDPEIRAHLDAENAYTERMLEPVAALREELVAELRARIKEDDSTVPLPDGEWAYYRRFVEGGQYPLLCRRPRDSGDAGEPCPREQVLVDGNREAEGQGFFAIRGEAHAPDHRLFAYAVDLDGSEYCSIRFRDSMTGDDLEDRLEDAQGDIAWANDGATMFYTVLDENHRPHRVVRHRVGRPDDAVVYEETDPGFFLSLGKTESGRFIVIEARDHADTSEVRLIDADDPEGPVRTAFARQTGVTCEFSDHGDRFFIRTNADGAIDFRIVEAPVADPSPRNWREVVPHREGRLVLAMMVFADFLVRLEREDALPRIVVRALADGSEHAVAFGEEAYALSLVPGYEYATSVLRIEYSSPLTPQRVYDYDMAPRLFTLRKEQEIPSGHDPFRYVCRRLHAPGHDGAQIPVTVLHARNAAGPLLLYGYGAYGHAIPASFSPHVFSLVDRGFVYAIAHVRGGTECGYRWYLDGKMKNKRNTFRDFISAAEYLRERLPADCILAHGASAGGMLMGAIANMRPDLFRAVIGQVPFVDVINTISDETLPLTPPEWAEWGDPVRDPEAFADMAEYCPYTNLRAQAYPHVLATGGLADPRVTYWEPAKWVAALRHHDTADSAILLHMNMDAGHGGASGRFDRLREIALCYAFALMAAGRRDETPPARAP